MSRPVRVLILSDFRDSVSIQRELRHEGMEILCNRADSKEKLTRAIHSFPPDLILSAFSMPELDGLLALEIAAEKLPEVPFIFVSEPIGEEKVVEVLKKGATDFVLKGRRGRLGPSVLRALRDADERVERRRHEDEMRSNQDVFRLITENVADMVALLDIEGKHLYNNRSYQDIVGSPDVLRGSGSFHEIHPDDRERIKRIFFKTVETGLGQTAEFRFVAVDGSVRYVESSSSAVRDADGRVSKIVVVSRDVTERKRAESEKKSLEEQFRQAQKMESLGILAGGVAHDFNNLLGIILGYGTLLQQKNLPSERVSAAVGNIVKATQRGSDLVRQLMTVARKTDASFAPVDVNTIVREVESMLGATLPKTVVLSTSLDSNLPALSANSSQLYQVLLNLAVNARDAMPQGGTLSIQTQSVRGDIVKPKFLGAEDGQYIAIRVKDNGTGMDEAIRQRIFEPFYTTKEKGKGTGLGLAMVYGVVKGHHGFIDVESEVGVGTAFHIFLPVRNQSSSELPTKESLQEVKGGSETILLVEDEEMLIELVETMLTSSGYRVLVARDGREAVEMYENHEDEVALVLSDLGLPRLGGMDAFLRMREINPQLRAIFATGYMDERSRTEMLEMGASRIIQKPYHPDDILRAVRSVLDISFGR